MRNFRNFEVYQKAMQLASMVYDLASKLPETEKYGLRSQITRCAVSIPSNIAEGAGRQSSKDFLRFLFIALGSSYELETQLELIKLKIAQVKIDDHLLEELTTVQKQLSKFILVIKENG
jgi:four helix bundle protein